MGNFAVCTITSSHIMIQACFLISTLPTFFLVGSIIYMACTTLLRALYICQSLNTSFQSFVKKSNLVIIMALVPQFLLSFHMLNSIRYFLHYGDHPFLLYKACMDPFSFYDVLFTEVLFMDNLLLFIYDLVIVLGNLYLWRFLNGQTEKI